MFGKRDDARDELIRELREERDRYLEEVKHLRKRNEKLQDDLITAVNPIARQNLHSAREAEAMRARGPRPPVPVQPVNGGADSPFLDMLHEHMDVRDILGVDWQLPVPERLPPNQQDEAPRDERPPPKESA